MYHSIIRGAGAGGARGALAPPAFCLGVQRRCSALRGAQSALFVIVLYKNVPFLDVEVPFLQKCTPCPLTAPAPLHFTNVFANLFAQGLVPGYKPYSYISPGLVDEHIFHFFLLVTYLFVRS